MGPNGEPEIIDVAAERAGAPTPNHTPEPIGGGALLSGLLDADPEAYEALIARFEGPLYRFFYYSHGDHELAEEQTSETFGNLVTAVHKMRGGADCLRAFVFGVARNVMRRGWRQKKLYPASDEEIDAMIDRRPSARHQAAARQALDRALAAIDSLGDPARQILLLRFVEGLSLAEIADSMDLPVGTVKSHIHRGRKQLSHVLGDRLE